MHNEISAVPRRSGLVVAALATATTVSALGSSIANVALPTIATDFGAPLGAVQWVILAYLLATTILIVPAGRLGDQIGRTRVLIGGTAVFTAGAVLAAFAPSLAVIVAARILQGSGAAAMLAMTVALVRETVPADRVGATMGTLGAATAAGMALGPALGGVLLGSLGWPAVFAALAALALVALALVSLAVPRHAPTTAGGAGSDLPGTLTLAVVLTAYAVAVTLQPGGWVGTSLLLALAVAGLFGFLALERRAAAPLVDLVRLRSVRVFPQLAVALLGSLIMMTNMVIGPYYLSGALRLEPTALGLAMAVGPVVAVLAGAPAGRLVDRFGTHLVTTIGLAEMALGMAALAVLPAWFGLPGFLVASIILTPGNQLFMAANNTAVMRSAGPQAQGAVSGVLSLARNVGQITGASVMAMLFSGTAIAVAGSVTDPVGAGIGTQVTFGVGALLGVLAAVALGARVVAQPA